MANYDGCVHFSSRLANSVLRMKIGKSRTSWIEKNRRCIAWVLVKALLVEKKKVKKMLKLLQYMVTLDL